MKNEQDFAVSNVQTIYFHEINFLPACCGHKISEQLVLILGHTAM